MRKFKSCLVAIGLCLAVPAKADQAEYDKGGLLDYANRFSNCAGLLDALSEYSRPAGEDKATMLRNEANGAEVAALMMSLFVLEDYENAKEMAKNMRTSMREHWTPIVDFIGVSGSVETTFQECLTLGPIQQELITEWRVMIYGAK